MIQALVTLLTTGSAASGGVISDLGTVIHAFASGSAG